MLVSTKILILAVVIVMVMVPYFWKSREDEKLTPKMLERQNLNSQKDVAYAALQELDFDFQMGKLSESDYHELRKDYESRAINILKELDKLKNKLVGA